MNSMSLLTHHHPNLRKEVGTIAAAAAAAAASKSHQSCPTLCDPIDGSPPGSCPWDSPGKNTGMGCHFLLLETIRVFSRSLQTKASLLMKKRVYFLFQVRHVIKLQLIL